MKRKLAAASLGLTLGTGGCVSAGRGLDDVAVKLAPRVTSRSDVKMLFGHPDMIAPITGGPCSEEWRYFGAPNDILETLVVRFDRAGTLCSWTAAPNLTAAAAKGS
jgi:hypothetical protein